MQTNKFIEIYKSNCQERQIIHFPYKEIHIRSIILFENFFIAEYGLFVDRFDFIEN